MDITSPAPTPLQRAIAMVEAALASLRDDHLQLATTLLTEAIKEMKKG